MMSHGKNGAHSGGTLRYVLCQQGITDKTKCFCVQFRLGSSQAGKISIVQQCEEGTSSWRSLHYHTTFSKKGTLHEDSVRHLVSQCIKHKTVNSPGVYRPQLKHNSRQRIIVETTGGKSTRRLQQTGEWIPQFLAECNSFGKCCMVVQQTPTESPLFELLNDTNVLRVAVTLSKLHTKAYCSIGNSPQTQYITKGTARPITMGAILPCDIIEDTVHKSTVIRHSQGRGQVQNGHLYIRHMGSSHRKELNKLIDYFLLLF